MFARGCASNFKRVPGERPSEAQILRLTPCCAEPGSVVGVPPYDGDEQTPADRPGAVGVAEVLGPRLVLADGCHGAGIAGDVDPNQWSTHAKAVAGASSMPDPDHDAAITRRAF